MRGVASRDRASTISQAMPWRHLAVRVIDQAFRDLGGRAGSAADQASAREFLAGSSMFCRWCEVADLDPLWMIARARVVLDRSKEGGTDPTFVRRRNRRPDLR